MSGKADITLTLRTGEEAQIACNVGNAMIRVREYNGGELLCLNSDSSGACRDRDVDCEAEWYFKALFQDYVKTYKEVRRERKAEPGRLRGPQFRTEGSSIYLRDCYAVQGRFRIRFEYHRDFFSQLCFILAVRQPDRSFKGTARCSDEGSAWKKQVTHVEYSDHVLTFTQQEGEPVYAEEMVQWTLADGRFVKKTL